jgi:hypothetical protein
MEFFELIILWAIQIIAVIIIIHGSKKGAFK